MSHISFSGAAEPLMGSSLLEEASVTSKNLVSMNSAQPWWRVLEPTKYQFTLGVDDGKTFNSLYLGKLAATRD